jgi:phosphohistidine phosphatase
MDLYLVRHGAAFEADPRQWPDDSQRPLTPEGEKRFRRAAEGLSRLETTVDVVLSSPWPRAWRTAELLHEAAGWPGPRACDALQGGRDVTAMLAALQPYRGASAVALVGHEPCLSELASYLLSADPSLARVEMKKGAVARLWIEPSLRPGSGVLRWLVTPKVLRA